MADPVIVPPTPVVNQPSGPADTSPGMEQLQKAFDRVAPLIRSTPSPPPVPSATEPEKPVTTPPAPTEKPPDVPPPQTPPAREEHKLPSFLEEALKLDPDKPKTPPPPVVEEEWPEELPPEEKKTRIKGLRDAYKRTKAELETIQKQRPMTDQAAAQRLQQLEVHNRQMAEALSRVGVEHSAQFQNEIIRPLYASWNEAARIVQDAGADPQELAKAMALQGKSQFEALDSLFAEMPESAKMEAHDALRTYRRFEDARRNAIANAPRTLEAIRAQETQRQYADLNRQREDMKGMFDRALTRLRDEAKVEVFQKTDDPNGDWWNKQSEQLVQQAKDLFLENTDMDRVALACLLAPAADAYRKLFLQSQKRLAEVEKRERDRIGNEPNLSESGGNASHLTPSGQMKDDLDKPFVDVFLREFHRAQSRSR